MHYLLQLIKMISHNYDSGQLSEEAFVLTTFCVVFGSLVDNLPLLQFLSYIIGSLIGLGTLLLNWNKYVESAKDLYRRIRGGK